MFGTQVGYDALEVIACAKWEVKQGNTPALCIVFS